MNPREKLLTIVNVGNSSETLKSARQLMIALRTDCLHYRGDLPCIPHHQSGVTCTCNELIAVKRRGVIIKLGAAGDVLRTTPLLRALDPVSNGTKVLWITHHPELLPKEACEVARPGAATLARLTASEWDFCWNLDKEVDACALAFHVRSKERAGYTLVNGVPYPADDRAWHKFATGIDNPYSKSNRTNYIQEIFDIVGLNYKKQEYWLQSPSEESIRIAKKILPGNGWIGLNTGAGWRWPSRIWSKCHWVRLIELMKKEHLRPVILGGPEEVELNDWLASVTGCPWPGVQSLEVFYAMIHQCSALVTSVTQSMHLGIAANKPLILFNNIFNPNEFELYGRGEILGPPVPCDCYYDAQCRTGRNCINDITPEMALKSIVNAARDLK